MERVNKTNKASSLKLWVQIVPFNVCVMYRCDRQGAVKDRQVDTGALFWMNEHWIICFTRLEGPIQQTVSDTHVVSIRRMFISRI